MVFLLFFFFKAPEVCPQRKATQDLCYLEPPNLPAPCTWSFLDAICRELKTQTVFKMVSHGGVEEQALRLQTQPCASQITSKFAPLFCLLLTSA